MGNDKVKQEAPERVWIDMSSSGNMEVVDEAAISADDVEYVRADLLATVRREEREAAFRDLLMVAKANLKIGSTDALDTGWNLALAEIIAALEASTSGKEDLNG